MSDILPSISNHEAMRCLTEERHRLLARSRELVTQRRLIQAELDQITQRVGEIEEGIGILYDHENPPPVPRNQRRNTP